MSNRLHISPHVNIPNDILQRNADIIYSSSYETAEIKVLDSQITIDESIALVSIIKEIASNNKFNDVISREKYRRDRNKAISFGSKIKETLIDEDELSLLQDLDEGARKKINGITGAEWQIEVFRKYGLTNVTRSLLASFEADSHLVKTGKKPIDCSTIHSKNLWYLIPYFPFFFMEKWKKYHQLVESNGGSKQIRYKSR
jgi:hypothetical protein